MRSIQRLCAALGVVAALLSTVPSQAAEVTVFAAASLTDVMQAIGKDYGARTGDEVKFSFASSSALAKQIENGARADIFISADLEWMDYLQSRGSIINASRTVLLGNRLVLVAPKDSTVVLKIAPNFPLASTLGDGRLSVADPESVPAGKYAKQALTTLGVWESVEPKLARAENVRAALAFVSRGEAPLGIVYTTDAMADKGVRIVDTFPEDTHKPIVYPAAIVRGVEKPEAAKFLAALRAPEATAVFEKAGFVVLK